MKTQGDLDKPVFWLDQILNGGLILPDLGEPRRALTLLLAGPPGTGKSTLALELCYRWATENLGNVEVAGWRTLYLTSEAHVPWMRQNAQSLGWNQIDSRVVTERAKWRPGTIFVLNAGEASELKRQLDQFNPQQQDNPEQPCFWRELREILLPGRPDAPRPQGQGAMNEVSPDVVVIDSLNTLPNQKDRERLFQNFMRLVNAGPRVLMSVLNCSIDETTAEFWEFASDVVLHLNRKQVKSGYLVRTIEVIKARYQEIAFGKHQLKTYQKDKSIQEDSAAVERFKETFSSLTAPHPPPAPRSELSSDRLKEYSNRASRLMRAHPYRSASDGGLVIFPSIHYVLSRYKRATPTDAGDPILPGIPGLKNLLHKGYPQGRCTAFIGGRGGHKSHVAYVELLHRLNGEQRNKALVVSLRDDEGVTRATMEKILQNRWHAEGDDYTALDAQSQLLRWEAEGRLEITYYPPGYITPEEFFHRLMLSINRLKASNPHETHITLLFNSLDQLSSRFPLCVEEEVFIPGIIQMLSGERISSFFVAAREGSDEPTSSSGRDYYYGLQTMAELILDFERISIKLSQLLRCITNKIQLEETEAERLRSQYSDDYEAVVLTVVRHAGGQAAGSKALLELLEDENPLQSIFRERDLIALPFAVTGALHV